MRPHGKPRLALVTSSLSAGGAERMMSVLANAWAEQGLRIGLFTLDVGTEDHYVLHREIERVPLDLLWESRNVLDSIRSNVKRLRQMRREIVKRQPQLVISFIDETNVRVLGALLVTGLPVIVSERVDPRHHAIGRMWQVLRRRLYPWADAVVVQTRSVETWARTFVSPTRIRIIPNALRPLPQPRHGSAEPKTILAIGRLNEQKGFDQLIHAFAATSLTKAGWRLLILGEGPERGRLEALASSLGLAGTVALPGVVPTPDMYMGQGDIFVLSSRYEGFPNVLLEAMGMGMAVVSFDCPSGPSEIIRHGENGLLIPPGDVPALARALERLAANEALRHELGARALEVRERFALPRIMAMWDELIEQILAKRQGAYRMTTRDEKLKDVL